MENIETLLAAVAQTQGFDDDEPATSTPSELGLENPGSAAATEPVARVSGEVGPSPAAVPSPAAAFPAVGQEIRGGEKRKRGRPAKAHLGANPPPPKRSKVEDEEEDVCFICFDGGSLVLCDRKGCPKAYHPACIKRDEAFFQTKSKWNCGWHICSVCRKNSSFMCYTCTYSLCKTCIKNEDFLCMRGNKGFCSTCIKPIMLIENKDQATNDSIKVDFDDKLSWEYLFKMYWLLLKEKLSLTLNEITQATNPWRVVATEACKPQFNVVPPTADGEEASVSCRSTEPLEQNKPRVDINHAEENMSSTLKDTNMPVANCVESDGNMFGLAAPISSRKRTTCEKSEDKAPQHDSNEYAAVDVHNISLIYLRRNLMENLLDDPTFNNKVIGSIVRIRISTNDQKPEVHRLVQVVGTSKVAEPYKIGNRTAEVMLEVLNLDKKEVVSIGGISNQDFTEDECKWLRQSIKCGLVKQFSVGEVKKKASALQSVRVDHWLAAEIPRLKHVSDLVAAKGLKKELRCYLKRIRLLKSPEERQRRISEVPAVHADPTMNPNYESEGDTRSGNHNEKDQYVRPSYSPPPPNDFEPISSKKRGKEEHSVESQARIVEKTDASGSNDLDNHTNQIDIGSSPSGARNDQAMLRSGLETSTAIASIGNSQPADNIETEKLWHYRDPNSKIQGPFSMLQLRKCNTTELFPPDMRIWTNHEQYDSLLLTDALNGKFHAAPDLLHKDSSSSQENGLSGGIVASEGTNRTSRDNKQSEAAGCNNSDVLSDVPGKVESCSSGWPRCWDLLKDGNPSADGVQMHSLPSPLKPETRGVPLTDQGRESDEVNPSSQSGEKNSGGPTQNPTSGGDELLSQPNNEGQSSEGNLRSLNIDLSTTEREPVPVFSPVSKLPDSSNQAENIDVLDLLSPTSNTVNQQHVCADTSVQGSGFLELLSPAPRSNNEDLGAQETDTKQSGFINLPMASSGPGWIGPSSLGIGGLQLPDVEWCGYSHLPARPPIQEWDTSHISTPSLRPPEFTCENVDAPAPYSHQLAHASSSDPSSDGPNWLAKMNEPIEFVALGEDSVSDLLAEVDAIESRRAQSAEVDVIESRRAQSSPTSASKFARELFEDSKDGCLSSIEDFDPAPEPRKSDALSSTSNVQFTSQSSAPCKPTGTPPVDAFDFFQRSSVNSSASSEGETSARVHSGDAGSEFHPTAPNNPNQEMDVTGGTATMAPRPGSDGMDPGWGQMQGNINLVTVQGNVNLVLGGPAAQGMANLGWGTNPGPTWGNPNSIHSPRNGNLPWDGQRKYGGERFNCPRDWGYPGGEPGFGRGRPPWGRQPYGGGSGYSRPLPKGQRVCKFYESGRCKKGAFCDYLHP